MKKIFTVLVCSMLLISFATTAFAEGDSSVKVTESKDLFKEFLSIAEVEEINTIDEKGDVIDNNISKKLKNHLLLKEYDEVFKMLEKYNLSLSYEEEILVPYDIGSEVSRKVYIYHLAYDKSKKFKKDWQTVLTIRYRENSNGTLTALGAPIVNRQINFGSAFNVEVSNATASYKYKNQNRAIEYYGSYRLRAKLLFPIEVGGVDLPIGRWYDWGTVHFSHTQK